MEKITKGFRQSVISLFLLLFCFLIFAETPSLVRHIRFPIWAEVDAYPGLEILEEETDENQPYSYAISRIKEISPFLVNGMVNGWEFTYVPSDKARHIEEFFEIKEIQGLEKTPNQIEYSSPWVEDNKFYCWIDYTRTEHQVQLYNLWSSINNPSIRGRGYGDLKNGFDGIKEASEDALKNAVRNYYRKLIKNKPREITGKVLIRKVPTIGINQGRYVINLDFFLECGTIKGYSQF